MVQLTLLSFLPAESVVIKKKIRTKSDFKKIGYGWIFGGIKK